MPTDAVIAAFWAWMSACSPGDCVCLAQHPPPQAAEQRYCEPLPWPACAENPIARQAAQAHRAWEAALDECARRWSRSRR